MITVNTIHDLRKVRQELPSPVGLVPTMGFLHDGHLSLVQRASEDCERVIVSIFVNPTQFGPNEDFDAYPRDIGRDLEKLEQHGVSVVWIPEIDEMYPPGFQTWVEVRGLSQFLEGKERPGHFQGVVTVVTKLLNAVQPDKAYFGQKDAQQAVIIKRLVIDLNIPVDIIVCPIIREADGLAMSSRNVYLNQDQRQAATVLYQALNKARNSFQSGLTDAEQLRKILAETIESEPLAEIQYVSCANLKTLEEQTGEVKQALLSLAIKFGNTRLIDNTIIGQ
jgi:pantoate--beta-alanine ligase